MYVQKVYLAQQKKKNFFNVSRLILTVDWNVKTEMYPIAVYFLKVYQICTNINNKIIY